MASLKHCIGAVVIPAPIWPIPALECAMPVLMIGRTPESATRTASIPAGVSGCTIAHTYATLARDLGVKGKVATDRLGHANETVAQQIYTHPSTGHNRAAAEVIAGLVAQALDRPR